MRTGDGNVMPLCHGFRTLTSLTGRPVIPNDTVQWCVNPAGFFIAHTIRNTQLCDRISIDQYYLFVYDRY